MQIIDEQINFHTFPRGGICSKKHYLSPLRRDPANDSCSIYNTYIESILNKNHNHLNIGRIVYYIEGKSLKTLVCLLTQKRSVVLICHCFCLD